MRKLIISLAAAGAALAVASPAAAQYYPQQYAYGQGYAYNGYSQGYNGHGYNAYSRNYGYNGYGQAYGYNQYGRERVRHERRRHHEHGDRYQQFGRDGHGYNGYYRDHDRDGDDDGGRN